MERRLVIAGVVVVIIAMALFESWGPLENISENGIERVFDKNVVAPGEVVEVHLRIGLDKGQDYYLIEESVPEEFFVLDDLAVRGNQIRLAKIQNAKDTIFSYKVKAPEEKGVYVFSGEYGMELVEGTRDIFGDSELIVE